MNIKSVGSIRAARAWLDLVQGEGFQSYSVLAACERSLWVKNSIVRPFRYLWNRCRSLERHVVYSVWDDDRPVILAPLYLNANGSWVIAGESHNLDYQDFVFNAEVSSEKRQIAFDFLMQNLLSRGVREIEIGQLDPRSDTWTFTGPYQRNEKSESKSVCIPLRATAYEEYFALLNKHAKQNVRTAYNRLRRDGHVIGYDFFSVGGIGQDLRAKSALKLLAECREIYRCRQEARYNNYRGLKHRFSLANCNYTTLSVPGESGFLAVVTVDGKIGAFMEGYLNKRKGSLEIPRLAINESFGWYSPGMLLVNETAKFLYANTNVRLIDLCRGTEKYKTDMGGEVYLTKRIAVKTERNK